MRCSFAELFIIDMFCITNNKLRLPMLVGTFFALVFHFFLSYISNCGSALGVWPPAPGIRHCCWDNMLGPTAVATLHAELVKILVVNDYPPMLRCPWCPMWIWNDWHHRVMRRTHVGHSGLPISGARRQPIPAELGVTSLGYSQCSLVRFFLPTATHEC